MSATHQTHWMMFRPEAANVVFFWNGKNLQVVFHRLETGTPVSDWYWNHVPAEHPNNEITESEALLFNQIADSKKRGFVASRYKRRYQVLERGTFSNQI